MLRKVKNEGVYPYSGTYPSLASYLTVPFRSTLCILTMTQKGAQQEKTSVCLFLSMSDSIYMYMYVFCTLSR